MPNKIHPRTITLFFLLALLFSILDISKVFTAPHCLAFDVNDDANHTFINLEQWRRVLAQGEWPMMNVYNNFGTPLIGDVITYPLSPLALTYAFLPGPEAMTLNRVLIGFLSLFLLFIFYHRRFSQTMSVGAALCTYYSPGFLWHSNHHHFQMSLIVLTGFLLLQERLSQRLSLSSYIGLCALSIVMFLSISLNVTMILCLLVLGYQIFLSQGLKDKSLWLLISALACGVVAVLPDTWLFLQAASRSMRRLAEYPVVSFEGPNKIFYTPIAAAAIYVFLLWREKKYKEAGLVLWLGVVPFGIVLLSRALPFLWKEIPLLGATDVVRLTWGAGIFLMIGCAGILSRWLEAVPGWRWQFFVCFLAVGMDAFWLPFRQDWFWPCRFALAVTWGTILMGFGGWLILTAGRRSINEKKASGLMVGFISAFVLVFYLYYGFFAVLGFSFPRVAHVTGRGAFSIDGSQRFPLPEARNVIPKNSRVAYDFDTMVGLDLRSASVGLFGAGARSTIMTNEGFSVGLFNRGLVKFDNYTGDYHFSPPWKAGALQAMGIAYAVQPQNDTTPSEQGWKKTELEKGIFLYQNPLPTGVVFLKKGDEISPVFFTVQGNGLNIELPSNRQGPRALVITLLKIPGWKAFVDGHQRFFLEDGNGFLVLPVLPQDHFVSVRYAPVSPFLVLLCFLMALVIPAVVVKKGFLRL